MMMSLLKFSQPGTFGPNFTEGYSVVKIPKLSKHVENIDIVSVIKHDITDRNTSKYYVPAQIRFQRM